MDKTTIIYHILSMQTISEMLFTNEMFQIFDHISKAFGFRTSVLDNTFLEVAPLRRSPLCRYCTIIQEELGMLDRCRENDRKQCLLAASTGKTLFYQCHAGLAEALYPLFIEDSCFGYIIVGQFRLESGIPDVLLSEVRDRNLRKGMEQAYESLPSYNSEQLKSILRLIEITTSYLIEHRMVTVKTNLLVERLLSFIESNLAAGPAMADAVAAVHRSPSSINQALHAVTGKSFKQLLVSMRMEKAAELLVSEASLSVAEVGCRVGMDDPFYFSRLFRKNFGCSPSCYRKRARA